MCLLKLVGFSVEPVETNILIFSLAANCSDKVRKIKAKNISISSMGHGKLKLLRISTTEVMHTYVLETLQN
jgi:threonine aldolase